MSLLNRPASGRVDIANEFDSNVAKLLKGKW